MTLHVPLAAGSASSKGCRGDAPNLEQALTHNQGEMATALDLDREEAGQ